MDQVLQNATGMSGDNEPMSWISLTEVSAEHVVSLLESYKPLDLLIVVDQRSVTRMCRHSAQGRVRAWLGPPLPWVNDCPQILLQRRAPRHAKSKVCGQTLIKTHVHDHM